MDVHQIYNKGDLVKLKYNVERNEDDGEYGFSIDVDEIGEIRYIVESIKDYGEIYMIKFSDKRYIQIGWRSIIKQ